MSFACRILSRITGPAVKNKQANGAVGLFPGVFSAVFSQLGRFVTEMMMMR